MSLSPTDWRETITGLVVAGFYYSFIGDELGAQTCWNTAYDVFLMGFVLKARLTNFIQEAS